MLGFLVVVLVLACLAGALAALYLQSPGPRVSKHDAGRCHQRQQLFALVQPGLDSSCPGRDRGRRDDRAGENGS